MQVLEVLVSSPHHPGVISMLELNHVQICVQEMGRVRRLFHINDLDMDGFSGNEAGPETCVLEGPRLLMDP